MNPINKNTDVVNLLVRLASTSETELVSLIENQPDEIKQAFVQQNAELLKQYLLQDGNHTIINERTVAQF